MLTLDMDTRPLIQLENDLDRFGKHAMPYAVRDTLNTAAYKAADLAKKDLGRHFTQRNSWTKRSISFNKTFARDIDTMESEMGSTLKYMRLQQEGFTQRKSGRHGVAIPTAAAAGQGTVRRRTRRLKKVNWLSQAKLNKDQHDYPYGGKTSALVRQAVATGRRVIFIEKRDDKWGRATGFYRVVGGRKKKVNRSWPKGAKLQLIYQVEKSSVRTEPHKWMDSPVKLVMKKLDKIYRDAITRQIRINRSFRDRG